MSNQYCRYCANAEDYNGGGTDFVCCVEGGSGIFYSASKANTVNHCKYYAFCRTDIFTPREYQPRTLREKLSGNDFIQTSLL